MEAENTVLKKWLNQYFLESARQDLQNKTKFDLIGKN